MSTPVTDPHYANVLAAADDLALVCSNTQQMQMQLLKVQAFADWSGMRLSPSKCEASAALWGAHSANKGISATDWTVIQPLLAALRVHGRPIHSIPPDKPFQYLGILLPLTMDWKPHLQMLLDMIKTKGLAIAHSRGSLHQKLEMDRQCIVSAIAYHLAVAPFSLAQVRILDVARARVLKAVLKIPNASPSHVYRCCSCHTTSMAAT